MKINIKTLNKKIFNIALQEEIERQSMNQKMIKDQIEDGIRFDGDEDLIAELDRLKTSFGIMQIRQSCEFDITDEEFMFLEQMIKNQTIISNSRIKDWQPDGSLARYFKYKNDGNEENYENARLNIIKYDLDLKECVKELAKILNVEYDPNLS